MCERASCVPERYPNGTLPVEGKLTALFLLHRSHYCKRLTSTRLSVSCCHCNQFLPSISNHSLRLMRALVSTPKVLAPKLCCRTTSKFPGIHWSARCCFHLTMDRRRASRRYAQRDPQRPVVGRPARQSPVAAPPAHDAPRAAHHGGSGPPPRLVRKDHLHQAAP
jgi:hypothetical protein